MSLSEHVANERQETQLAEKCQLQRDSPCEFQTLGPSGSSLKKYSIPKGQHASQRWPSQGVKGTAEGHAGKVLPLATGATHQQSPTETPLLSQRTLFIPLCVRGGTESPVTPRLRSGAASKLRSADGSETSVMDGETLGEMPPPPWLVSVCHGPAHLNPVGWTTAAWGQPAPSALNEPQL